MTKDDAAPRLVGRPRRNACRAMQGRRQNGSQQMYLTVWEHPDSEPTESRGSEVDLVPEFHRLREAEAAYALELGSIDVHAHCAWLTWRRPKIDPAIPRTCPHCGGAL